MRDASYFYLDRATSDASETCGLVRGKLKASFLHQFFLHLALYVRDYSGRQQNNRKTQKSSLKLIYLFTNQRNIFFINTQHHNNNIKREMRTNCIKFNCCFKWRKFIFGLNFTQNMFSWKLEIEISYNNKKGEIKMFFFNYGNIHHIEMRKIFVQGIVISLMNVRAFHSPNMIVREITRQHFNSI